MTKCDDEEFVLPGTEPPAPGPRDIVRARERAGVARRLERHREQQRQRELPLGAPPLPANFPRPPRAGADGVVSAPERIRYMAGIMRKGLWKRGKTCAVLAPHLGITEHAAKVDAATASRWVRARLDELGVVEMRAEIVCDLRWARARAKAIVAEQPDKAARLVIDAARALAEITGAGVPRSHRTELVLGSQTPAELPPWEDIVEVEVEVEEGEGDDAET